MPHLRHLALFSLIVLLLATQTSARDLSTAHPSQERDERKRRDQTLRRSPVDLWVQHGARRRVLDAPGLLNVLWDNAAPTDQAAATDPSDESTARRTEMLQLLQCINSGYRSNSLSWDAAMHDELSTVQAVGLWWSKQAPQVPLTVVTTATLSRIEQLKASCVTWPGPYSVVLYEALLQAQPGPLTQENRQRMTVAVQEVAQFVADMQQRVDAGKRACQPNVLLVYELFKDTESAASLFPYNLLRNLARLQVHTPLIAMVDVDLLLSRSLHTRMADPQKAQELVQEARDQRKAFIIPAFDLHSEFQDGLWAESLASSSKSMAADAYKQGILDSFSRHSYAAGHSLTHYEQWITAKSDYKTNYEYKCEPWLIMDRFAVPWHDERYRGYGMDKVQHVAHMNATGTRFMVLHDVFTIHRPHHKSVGRAAWIASKGKLGPPGAGLTKTRVAVGQTLTLFTHNMGLLEAQVALQAQGSFQPALNPATILCHATLPWWRQASKRRQAKSKRHDHTSD